MTPSSVYGAIGLFECEDWILLEHLENILTEIAKIKDDK